ncbi:MAG: tetratricopeptide repeat protein [Desulfobacterales bacterium]|jgi:class 3 adenylate cyclase/tetratricopeptide (TPR) repeat protein
MKCPNCQSDNRDGVKFCEECGAKFERECPDCEANIPIGKKFCGECGCRLPDSSESPSINYEKPHSYTPKYLVDKILTDRSSIEGERKLVTVFFADVAKYTSIAEKLDAEDVHQIMDDCFKILMDEIHKYEGTINQFTGDGIMALFGAPVACEDHAQRACYAALSIQNGLKAYAVRLKQDYGIVFKMRIGLNTGQVVVGSIGDDLRMDYTAISDTTNIASHLQQIAKPGEILISDKTYRHIKGYFECNWLGEERLKNRKKPVKYCKLQHEGVKRSRLEVEVEERALTPFVDREEELDMMLHLFDRVKEKEGQVICIVGEAGEGKTRLIYEFKKQISSYAVKYLESQCISYGKHVPYYPVVEMLRKSFDIKESDGRDKVRMALTQKIKQLDKKLLGSVPILFRLLALETDAQASSVISDPEQAKEMTFETLRLLILSESQVKPMVVVFENLQWMDSTSEEFISYLVESIANFPVFLILTYRVGYTNPFGSRSYLRQISLSRFSEKQSNQIIQALIPKHRLPHNFSRLILNKAEGNPLYLEEILKSLKERNIIIKDSSGHRLAKNTKEIEIPETIQEIVLARVDRLKEPSKRTIQAAAVIGREFTLRLLARQEELERQLKRYMKELKKLELVREKSLFPEIEYMFKHAVTKDVIYSSLLLKHRKKLHRTIAESIVSLYENNTDDYLEMLAFHYLHSDVREKSITYLIKAGEKAKSIYANAEAIQYFQKALEVMAKHDGTRDQDRKKTHRNLADLYDLIGDYPQAVQHYTEEMKFVSSVLEKTEVLRRIGMIWEKKGDLTEALKFYTDALALINQTEYPLEAGRIYTNIGWLHNRNGDYDKAMDFCTRALEIFRSEKSDYETALALNNLAVIHEFRGQWNTARKYNEEGIDLMEKLGDQRKLGSFYISLGLLDWKRGKLDKSKNYFEKSAMLMEATGNTLGIASSYLNLGRVYTSEGRLSRAFTYLEKSLHILQKMGIKSKLCQNYTALAEACVKKNDLKSARDWCDRAMEIALEAPYPFDQGRINSILGQIKTKENGKAEEHFLKSLEIFKPLGRKYEMALVMEHLGRLKIRKGQKTAGRQYIREAERIFREFGVEGY